MKYLKNWFSNLLANYYAEKTQKLYISLDDNFKKDANKKRIIARKKYLKQLKLR